MRFLPSSLALAGALALGTPATAFAAPSAPVASTEVVSYAEREAADRPDVEQYEGGSTFVITMSGTTLVVLLLLLIII